ncbi:MAG: ribosome recycling factor [Patescibacteria group bacterium]|nr:ribosome recycling factor [Patescibacteria group bacterium]MBU2509524.1 ribosome recycling factor [Patescibacteria group bacterium]
MIDEARTEFNKVIEHLDSELKNLHSGRANASMVEDLMVQAYDSSMDMKSVASISVPDARTIQIEPWDKNLVKEIEKALLASRLGLAPNISGTVIRLSMPPMTEENRKELVKVVNQKVEQARISVRNVREGTRDKINAQEKEKKISEDDKFRLQEQLDKVVSEYNEKIEQIGKTKEREILTI